MQEHKSGNVAVEAASRRPKQQIVYGEIISKKPVHSPMIETFYTGKRYVDKTGSVYYLCCHQPGQQGGAFLRATLHSYDILSVFPNVLITTESGPTRPLCLDQVNYFQLTLFSLRT